MSLRVLISRLSGFFHGKKAERRLDEELRCHLAMLEEDQIRRGLPAEQARIEARRAFGSPDRAREAHREQRGLPVLDGLAQDLRHGIRLLGKNPGFTAVTVITLALGIGANAAVFSFARALLFKSLPVPQPQELVRYRLAGERTPAMALPETWLVDLPLSGPMYDALRQHQSACTDLLAWGDSPGLAFAENGETRWVRGFLASGSSFRVLGLTAMAGRLLDDGDDQPGGGPGVWSANISYGFWNEHFNLDPEVVGHTMILNHVAVNIVGVLPRGFGGVIVGDDPQIVLPLEIETAFRGAESMRRDPGNASLTVLGRLRPGVSLRQAAANLSAIAPQVMDEALPGKMREDDFFSAVALDVTSGSAGWSDYRREYQKPLLLVQGLAATVLLLVGANLAALLLARAAARRREMEVRSALGASRARLVRQMLTESSLIAAAGLPLACLFAWQGSRVIALFLAHPGQRLAVDLRPDWLIAAAALGAGLITMSVAAAGPALLVTRITCGETLQSGARHSTARGSRGWLIRWLVPPQAGLSLFLVAIGALCVTSLVRLLTRPSGMREQGVYMAGVDVETRPERSSERAALYARLFDRIQSEPGVEAACLLAQMPMSAGESDEPFRARDSAGVTREDKSVFTNVVSPSFFETLGIGRLAGRDFAAADSEQAEKVCIVNASAARFFFPSEAALGQYLEAEPDSERAGPVPHRIVGVVEDAKYYTLHQSAPRTIYLPFQQNMNRRTYLALAVRGADVGLLRAAYERTVRDLAPSAPLAGLISLRAQMLNSVAFESMAAALTGFLGLFSLLLTCVCLYAQMAFNVTERTTEIGIRMALGATRSAIVRMVVSGLAISLALGVALGLAGAAAAARLMETLLYETGAKDPVIALGAVGCLLITGLAAAFVPARRAASIDPMRALRTE